jgi:hypothetical protein
LRVLPRQLNGADFTILLVGGAATLAGAYLSVRAGAEVSVGALLAVALFVGAVIGFVVYPHVTVALTVLMFPFLPLMKVFVWPEIGPLKDLIVLAAIAAALILYLFAGRRPDRWVLILVLLLMGLYVINVGGEHNLAWAQGVRLVGEPLMLLLVGMVLPQPRRTFRFAMASLVAVCCVVAAYGLVQQLVGPQTLVAWGYSFNDQVRTLSGGQLRSFGSLDDPSTYAALLSLGLVAVLLWLRRGRLAWAAGALILMGLGASFVRTAVLVLIASVGLVMWRRGYIVSAVLLAAGTLIAGGVTLANTRGTEAHTYAVAGSGGANGFGGYANVILNGRVSAWTAALGPDPADWVLGRGVGEVGTASVRARYGLTRSSTTPGTTQSEAVDSGYLAAVADVGFAGLALLLAIFGRLIALAADAARQRKDAGWAALGLLAAVLIPALTGASFTGFPGAFLGLLLIGIALAAARAESGSSDSSAAGSRVAVQPS